MRRLVAGLLLTVPATPGGLAQEATEMMQGTPVTELRVEPAEVRAGMFFAGATIRVSALVPDGYGITISCVGREEPAVLNRKGKALGLIWMNVGEVEIDGAPVLYLLHTSGDLGEMAADSSLEALGVGYDALKRGVRVGSPEEDRGEAPLFDEFVGLKESDGLYSVSEAAVEGTSATDGMVRVSTEFHLSAKTSTGEYQILAHGFAGEDSRLLGTASLRVVQVGMAASIRTLATEHGLLYGILAVVVAIVVGLLTGVLFGLGSKKAH